MAAMRHPNVVLYLGVCLDPPCVVTEYCARGSLNDVLKRALYNPKYAEQLDWRVRYGPCLSCTRGEGCQECAVDCLSVWIEVLSVGFACEELCVTLLFAAGYVLNIRRAAAG